MLLPNSAQTRIDDDVLLDGRLALFHQEQRWLAVADLHFGYEISQRAAGRLMPMWGMSSIEERLTALIDDYSPAHLVIVGDLVHDKAARAEAATLIQRLGERCEVIVLAGNHDRQLAGKIEMRQSWQTDGFYFHHGHCAADALGLTQITGHHHPAGTIRDGAGLRLKLPAFVQQRDCWILPAFSPGPQARRGKPSPKAEFGSALPRGFCACRKLPLSCSGSLEQFKKSRSRQFGASRVGWASRPPSDASCVVAFGATAEDRFGETPKPAGETPTLPETRTMYRLHFNLKRSSELLSARSFAATVA